MKSHLPILTAGIVCLSSTCVLAQLPTVFVIPKVPTTGSNGSSGNNLPGTGATDFRGQWSYDQSEWPDGNPRTIKRIRCRASDFAGTGTSWTGGVYPSCTIKMSTATANYDALSSNYAANAGADEVVVYQGPITITPGAGTGSGVIGVYYMDVTLQNTFDYNPAKGDLLVEWITAGDASISTSSAAMTTLNNSMRYFRRAAGAHTNATATTTRSRWGFVMELTTDIIPGLFPNFDATPDSGSSNLNVTFTDTSVTSSPTGVIFRLWDFGDGSPTANGKTVMHTYGCGTFSPKLTVFDAQGGDFIIKTGLISAGIVGADFTADKSGGFGPLTVSFTDNSSGGPTAWTWDFGDGSPTSSAQNPMHTYTTNGAYDVKLTATTTCSTNSTTKTAAIRVGEECLDTIFTGGNGLTGANVGNMFDVDVKNTNGLKVTALNVNTRAGTGTPISIEVWMTPTTYSGVENDQSQWVKVSQGTGNSSGGGGGSKTRVDIDDFFMPTGQWGLYVIYLNGGIHYTNGNGTNQTASNADLALSLGTGKGTPWTGGAFSPACLEWLDLLRGTRHGRYRRVRFRLCRHRWQHAGVEFRQRSRDRRQRHDQRHEHDQLGGRRVPVPGCYQQHGSRSDCDRHAEL